MFRPMRDITTRDSLSFTFDGELMTGRAGDTVAASLLSNGITVTRYTTASRTARAPYCMMGICFDCLVVIDGVGNRQGCLVPLREGMRVKTQHGRRDLR